MGSARHTLRIEPRQSLLYDRTTRGYSRVSSSEAFLLAASREIGLKPALALLKDKIGKKQANLAFGSIEARGFIDPGRGFEGRVLELPAVDGAFSSPLVVHLGVTLACNFSCHHCYSSSGRRAPGELRLEEIQGLIDQMAAMGAMKLVLGGGEPFLRKDLERIVSYANDAGVDTFVHTNASLLDANRLRSLSKVPPAELAVSIDGPDATSNDVIRGEGTFERIRGGLQILREHYTPGFNISATITPKNADQTDALVDLARREGAKLLLLRPAYPAGEARSEPGLVCDRDTFARAIDRARGRANELGMSLDAPHPYEQGEPDFEGFGCVAARVVLGVSPTGEVTPCLNLPSSFSAATIRTLSLEEIWRSGIAFRTVRDVRPSGDCDTCRHFDTCRGGCRVRSLHAGHGLGGTDAWCHYEPKPGAAARRARLQVLPG